MTSTKFGAYVMTALLIVYILLLANTGVSLLRVSEPIAQAMGVLILAFPLVGAWAIFHEFRFAIRLQRLENLVNELGTWPQLNLETRPSGRPIKASADAAFAIYSQAASAEPLNWQNWFNLGLVYSAAGDKPRARAAFKKAIALAPKH
jgi:tetratricopeptide (TPR) repeat protein